MIEEKGVTALGCPYTLMSSKFVKEIEEAICGGGGKEKCRMQTLHRGRSGIYRENVGSLWAARKTFTVWAIFTVFGRAVFPHILYIRRNLTRRRAFKGVFGSMYEPSMVVLP